MIIEDMAAIIASLTPQLKNTPNPVPPKVFLPDTLGMQAEVSGTSCSMFATSSGLGV